MDILDFDFLEIISEVDKELFEDSYINGKPDLEGKLIEHHFDKGLYVLEMYIDIKTGKIKNKFYLGKNIKISYKVSDQGDYRLISSKPNINVFKYKGNYVPDFLDTKGNGFGDVISLEIDGEGFVKNWNPENIELDMFEKTNDFNFKYHKKAEKLGII